MVRLSTHRVKKLGMVIQTKMSESPYVQRSSTGTTRDEVEKRARER